LGEKALDRLAIKPSRDFERPSVYVSGSDVGDLTGVFAGRAVPERYAVVIPGATYGPAKSWPWGRYRELVRGLSQEIAVVLTGGHGEKELCDFIADGRDGVYNICGQTTLDQLFALLSRASVVIANDSGPPHVAASLGIPVVVLFGSTSPAWTAPLGTSVNVVSAPVDCSPCFRKICPTKLECFAGIEPCVVLEHARVAVASNAAGARL
jgi:heptosyltransferase-2